MQEESKYHPRPKQKIHPALILLCALAIATLLGALALGPKAPPAPPDGITMWNYERLQTGMSYAKVCEILGKPGTEVSRSAGEGYVAVLYQWQGQGAANIHVMFGNDKLNTKAQFGLK